MIRPDNDRYSLTAKGDCFVEYLRNIPEPVQTWTMP